MDTRLSMVLAIAGGLALIGATANAACIASHSRNCVDLTLSPLTLSPPTSQQIIAAGGIAGLPSDATASTYRPSEPLTYTGPTVGVSSMVRRAPEIRYRWSME